MKTNKLSIYYIKDEFVSEKEILQSVGKKQEIENVGIFYFDPSATRPPSWLSDFFNDRINTSSLYVSGAKGILIVPINYKGEIKRFAICFGMGRHMLSDGVIEERFGLRVTLNSVLPESIRSIEKRTLGAVSKISKEQMSKASKASDFGIDIEQDLIRAVTGTSKFPFLGRMVSGADALSVSVKVNVDNIIDLLQQAFERYLSTDYEADFGWVDQIKEVKNSGLNGRLNDALLVKMNARDLSKIWMAIPELIEWSDLKGLRYVPRQEELDSDVEINKFLDSFPDGVENLQQLKSRNVVAFSASTDQEIESWTAYKCIYGEVELDDKQYIINNGKWYEVNNDFVATVNEAFNNISLSNVNLPEFNHKSEEEYSEELTKGNADLLLMDRKNIMHGGGQSRIEFCDVLTKDKKLIHIKPYGASSVLSHLFQQGLISGELFVTDAEFRKKLNKVLAQGWKLANSSAKINASEYEVVYAIISNRNEARPNIPFFSKVGIKNAKRRLEGFGYKVSLKRIRSIK